MRIYRQGDAWALKICGRTVLLARVGDVTVVDLRLVRFLRLGVAWRLEVCGRRILLRLPSVR